MIIADPLSWHSAPCTVTLTKSSTVQSERSFELNTSKLYPQRRTISSQILCGNPLYHVMMSSQGKLEGNCQHVFTLERKKKIFGYLNTIVM